MDGSLVLLLRAGHPIAEVRAGGLLRAMVDDPSWAAVERVACVPSAACQRGCGNRVRRALARPFFAVRPPVVSASRFLAF